MTNIESTSDEVGNTEPRMPDFAVVVVGSVLVDLPDQFPTVNLHEQEPPYRGLSFPVGLGDGAAIAAILEDRPPLRPASQDLLAVVLQRSNIDVIAARITGLVGGNFSAELDLVGPRGREVISCRASDAINAALRHPGGAPILVDVTLLA
ncbi:MAG: bifunctional nuclease domain-containing protein [Actinomycetota bacterium]